jgi:GNAT superfamily N-acetyltransferase
MAVRAGARAGGGTPWQNPCRLVIEMKIETRQMVEADFELSYGIKKEAIGPHVAKRWGWDNDVQRRIHRERWEQRDFLAICVDGVAIGTVWIGAAGDHWRFGEFYIRPEFQNKGIGSSVLAKVIADADRAQLPVRLEYLKWNPVGALYERHGFRRIAENETSYFMERKPEARTQAFNTAETSTRCR